MIPTLRPYQQQAVDELRTALSKYRRVVFQLTTGGGKCFGANTPILMYDGSIKKVQDVVVGDILMGDDSKPRKVESTCTGREMLYRITPNKGDSFVCNESHILALRYSDAKHDFALKDIQLTDYLVLLRSEKHILKQYRSSVEFEENRLPIDPYILGLWLADGSKTYANPDITVNNKDIEILDYLRSIGGHVHGHQKGACCSMSLGGIENPNGTRKNSNLYRDEFKKCLFGSHYDIGIPKEYLINSRENRLQLLAGILDGDGDTSHGGYNITTKFSRLRDDILYLARSLGLAAYCSIRKVDISKLKGSSNNDIRVYYRISISGFCENIPLKLKRKQSKPRKMNKNVLNVGFSIEPIGEGDYYGFEISGNNRRFLLGDFTVAHNTVCFSYIVLQSARYGHRVLILSNRCEILTQNGGALAGLGVEVEYVNPKHRDVPKGRVAVAMSQTLKRRIAQEEWLEYVRSVKLCIVDEAHCCEHDFVYSLLDDRCFVLLVTATPSRQGKQEQLGHFAKAMVCGISTKELIRQGYLAPARHFTIAAPKLDDVEINDRSKEYNAKSLAVKFEDRRVYDGVIDEWFRICPDRKTIMFCVSAKQAIECTKIFVERGVSARYVLSGSFDDEKAYSGERSEVMDAFKRGEFQVLVNVGICTAGTDIPDVTCIVANYATTSMVKWRQSIGRGSRICEGKEDFYILDAGDNIRRLGFFEQEIEFSLWHDEGSGGGIQMMKECPTDKVDINHQRGCGSLVPTSCKYCPCCGFKFITDKDAVQIHLEEVAMEESREDMIGWAAKMKLEGWNINRIMIQVCLANVGRERSAVEKVYQMLYPEKGADGARRFWFSFKTHVWDKVKKKRNSE